MRPLLPLVFLLTAPVVAQTTPDTTAPWRYFPLDVGNVWEYGWWATSYGTPASLSHFVRLRVVADTTLDGFEYAVLREESFELDGTPRSSDTTFVRFDSARAVRVHRPSGSAEVPWAGPREWWACRLDAPFRLSPGEPSPVECFVYFFPDAIEGSSQGGYEQPVTIGGETVVTTLKTTSTDFSVVVSATYAADLGLVHLSTVEWDGYFLQLEYARVGGVAVGTPVVSAEPPAAPPTTLRLEVRPNPVRTRAAVTLTLAAPAAVTVRAFDVLGRPVATLAEGRRAAGTHDLTLDARSLPAGVYLVRAEAGRSVTTRRVVVLGR